ncbi:MAG: choice-of-anchor Q domain-containing protein [Syntrophales bacterium]
MYCEKNTISAHLKSLRDAPELPGGARTIRLSIPKWIILVIVSAAVLLLADQRVISAADWYIDNAAGGMNNGTSWENAWRDFSDVVWGASGVKAGDTIYISGGNFNSFRNYSGSLNIAASGAQDFPITIRPGQDAGHNGTVVFNGGPASCITAYNRSYIVIDGNVGGAARFLFQNGVMGVWNALIDTSGMDHFIVRYCEFKTATIGLNSTYCVASEFDHNYFHDMRGEAALRLDGSHGEGAEGPGWWDSNKIHDNIFLADAPSDGAGIATDQIQGTSALSIYNNIIEYQPGPNYGWQHPDGCQVSGNYNKIYSNRFRNCPNAAVSMDYGGSSNGHYYIYNNVIECTVASWSGYMKAWDLNMQSPGMVVDDMLFANNTVCGINHTHTIAVHVWDPSIRLTNWKIMNNIFYQCGEMGGGTVILIDRGDYAMGVDVVIDYNLLNDGGQGGKVIDIGGQKYTQPHPRENTPQFVSYTYRGAYNDYHLQPADSGARGRGISLSSIFTTDRDGSGRSSGAAWDIGAYESGASSSSRRTLSAPRDLRITK